MMKLKNKIILLISLFFILGLRSQSKNLEFDSLIKKKSEEMLSKNIPRKDIIKWNLEMLEKAKKENYKKGEIWANINLGIQYYNLSKPDVSLKYLNKAKVLADKISADNETYAKIFQEFSQVYFTLGLYDVSLKYNSKGIYYCKKVENLTTSKIFLEYAYRVRALTLDNNKNDSALFYLQKALTNLPGPSIYSDLGSFYIGRNLDSAKIYLGKAEVSFKKIKNVKRYDFSVLYYRYANLYVKENKNREAIKYLEKSLELASNGKNRQHLLNVYKLLAETYNKIGDFKKERKMLDAYKNFNDSYKDAQARSVNFTIQNLENNLNKEEQKYKYKIILYSIISVFIMGLLFYFVFNKKKDEVLDQKDKIIQEQEFNSKRLEKKLIDGVDDLYESAKSRDSNFYNKFQKLYPNFNNDLLAINSNLQNKELLILAYIYLNFETKEIADILFLSPKTVQNKKHSIRKKLKIPSKEDFYIWLRTYIN
ncbi:Tetratricopeptide repeat-containing protein [Halpernia humi]|uniref:Tetratricopeptide repeat-containing protein n=2 Tax=Halpernia humi TaxID=493375 RepID=A0A1H5TFY4_9FLAO|nr:Tetratricopeptide repeat-containing protein [Halpernia humi]